MACTKTILATQTRIKNSVKNVAMKNIRRGEEVTFDYSTSENENRWYLICHCENKNCRPILSPIILTLQN
ncbi:MAG TPA: hypothetical protein VFM28_00685 [Nitrososphaeraceae archaeon]|nr:hypothetical protein [Nitrososphaeraceae archaeon]